MQATFHVKRERIHRFHMERYQKLVGSLHFHSHIELLLLHEGEAEVWINDTKTLIRENEMAMVPSYAAHRFRSLTERVDCSNLFVPTFLCPDFIEALRNKSIKSPVIRDAVAMEKIRHAAEELSRGDLNAVEQTGYIHVILGTVLKQLDLQESHLPQDVALPEKLLFYVNEHYKEDMTPAGVAQALGYSANHLSKCFRAHFQIGMGSYINTLRLKNAVMLMREKKMSITDCAMESGFGSLRTFYRAFEEEFGCTPREYLKQDSTPV